MKKYIIMLLPSVPFATKACDCSKFDSKVANDLSDWVFYGKVIAAKLYCVKDSNDFYSFENEEDFIHFKDSLAKNNRSLYEKFTRQYLHIFWLHEINIIDAVKGDFIGEKVYIHTSVERGSCAIYYPIGKEVVILAEKTPYSDDAFFKQLKTPKHSIAYTHICYDVIAHNLRKNNQWTTDIDLFRPKPTQIQPKPIDDKQQK